MPEMENRNIFCNNSDLHKNVSIPVELYESLRGRYYIGYGDNLTLGPGQSAWARLYNPPNSGVNLYVNVWTVAAFATSPDVPSQPGFRAQFWFNAPAPSEYDISTDVTPSNTAHRPKIRPKVKLQLASDVTQEPSGGIKAFVRRGELGSTAVETENGKLIFPPGGSFLVFVSLPENPDVSADVRVAFGWFEEDECEHWC